MMVINMKYIERKDYNKVIIVIIIEEHESRIMNMK